MTTGEHGGYEAAARQYNDCIRAGQIAQAVEWLMEMAEILESEKRYTDALKLGMLTFYFATSGVYAKPVIEDHLAKQICRVVWAGRVEDAREMLGRFVMAQAAK